MCRLETLAVGKACCARIYSYSRLKQREPLIAVGSHQGGLNFCVRVTPLWDKAAARQFTLKERDRVIMNQINIGAVSNTTFGKLLKIRGGAHMGFPSTCVLS